MLSADIDSKDIVSDSIGSDGGNIEGLYTVHFDYDKAALSGKAKKTLRTNAEWIKSNRSSTVQLEGHCDERGSSEYNLALGERRANAVKRYLISLGVSSRQLSIISYGEEKLLSYGSLEADHYKNRRVNFVPVVR